MLAIGLTGTGALVLGLLVYLTERTVVHSSLIPNGLQASSLHLFGDAADWLPSFLHSFAFSVLTAGVFWPCDRRVLLAGCAFWALINVLFELGQHPDAKHRLAAWVIKVFPPTHLGDTLARYFSHGVFDPKDIAAAVAGAFGAAVFLLLVFRLSSPGDRHG